jgi:hypothetical protein
MLRKWQPLGGPVRLGEHGDARRLALMQLSLLCNRHHAQCFDDMDIAHIVEATRDRRLDWENGD